MTDSDDLTTATALTDESADARAATNVVQDAVDQCRAALRSLHATWDQLAPPPFSDAYEHLLTAIKHAARSVLEVEHCQQAPDQGGLVPTGHSVNGPGGQR